MKPVEIAKQYVNSREKGYAMIAPTDSEACYLLSKEVLALHDQLCLLLELRRRRENQTEAARERDELLAEVARLKDEDHKSGMLRVRVSKQIDALKEQLAEAEAEIARRDAVAGEPFAYIDSSHLDEFGWGYVFKQPSPMRAGCKFPVYTAAQPAVLPPGFSPSDMRDKWPAMNVIESHAAAMVWNQFRADALALGAQAQKVVDLPAGREFELFQTTAQDEPIKVMFMRSDEVLAALAAANVKYEVKK